MGCGMKPLVGSFAMFAALIFATSVSYADISFKQCLAVSNVAEVNFDATLTVSIYEHRPTRFCSIDVNPGPSPASTSIIKPAIAAVQQYQKLATTKPSETDAAWDAFMPVLRQALVTRWRTNENSDQLGTLENVLIGQEAETVRQCVADAALKLTPFERRTDVISCGIVEGNSFVIEAISEAIRLVLILPGPSAG